MPKQTLTAELWLPQPPRVVFPFFADAANLEAITPPWLRFSVLAPSPIIMRAGTVIDYRLRVHGFPLQWQSEITSWSPPFLFVDEQRRGPYRYWRHTHTFEEKDGGTLCRDLVEYSVPGGRIINWLIVRRDLQRIFAYRQASLGRHFQVDAAAVPNGSAGHVCVGGQLAASLTLP
jgi:ligand-binding SRPBCC domain-containing protein